MTQAAAAAPDRLPRRVIKGGSWLCAPDFCARYRPAARQPMDADLGSSHIGFRTVSDAPRPAGAAADVDVTARSSGTSGTEPSRTGR